jgi:hypothetical protein
VSGIYSSYHHNVGTSLSDHPVEVHKGGRAGRNQLLGRSGRFISPDMTSIHHSPQRRNS